MSEIPNTVKDFFLFFVKDHAIPIFVFCLAPACIVFETNVMPYGLKVLIDTIAQNGDKYEGNGIPGELLNPILLIVCAWLIMTVLLRLSKYWESFVIPKFEANIRLKVLRHVVGHSYSFFTDNMVGNVAGKINDLPLACNSIREVFSWNIVSTVFVLISSCAILFSVHCIFVTIILAWCVIHILLVAKFSKNVDQASGEHAADQSSLNGSIIDEIANISNLKSHIYDFNEYSVVNQFQDQEVRSNGRLIRKILAFEIILDIPVFVMLLLTLYFLVVYWQKGLVTVGDFVLTFNVILSVMYNMLSLGHVLVEIYKETGRIRQSINLLLSPIESMECSESDELTVTKGAISFKHVQCTGNRSEESIAEYDLDIPGGSKIAIVGQTGSGKSSFLNLIMRFYRAKSGRIEIDAQNIYEVSENSLRKNVSYVSQEIILFHRSIKENIRFGRREATDDDVIEAAKLAHCHDFICSLPDGYNTIVGDRGSKLSGGQRQQIMIARALLKNSQILLLDEATSALDAATEELIRRSLRDHMPNKTVIMVAHRLSTISQFERILVLENFRIVEDGTFEELINKEGKYYEMWKVWQDNRKVKASREAPSLERSNREVSI